MPSVIAVARSENDKIGAVAATYAPLSTCPKGCRFRDDGCYAESGHIRYALRRMNADGASPSAIARQEAAAIDGLPGTLPLRVHVSGDCRTNAAALIVGRAMSRYVARSGQPAWTYTHAWRTVDRRAWGGASVLASCETAAEVWAAGDRGYAAVLVVARHEGRKAYRRDGLRMIPCPEQTAGVRCVDCRLCMADGMLRATGSTVAIAAHRAVRKIGAALERANGE